MFDTQYLIATLLSIPGVFLALSVHECAHGYISYKLGDPTAKNLGRLTLNPMKHIDIMGFICMVFLGFGWAKAVPVNARYYKKPRRDMALVAAAGPISNVLMGFIGVLGLYFSYFLYSVIAKEPYSLYEILYFVALGIDTVSVKIMYLVIVFFQQFAALNVGLAVFNLLPVPPLDGSRIAYIFLPTRVYFGIMRYERYIMLGMFLLLWAGAFSGILSSVSGFLLEGMESVVRLIPIFRF